MLLSCISLISDYNVSLFIMEANDFIAKIKASGGVSDKYDIAESFEEYHDILLKLSSKDKASFSLNVLCILCRYIVCIFLLFLIQRRYMRFI